MCMAGGAAARGPLLPALLLAAAIAAGQGAEGDFPPFACPPGQVCEVEMRSQGVRVAPNPDPGAIRSRDVSGEGALFISGTSTFKGPMEAGFTCHLWERRLEAPHWIVGFAPAIDGSHGHDVIHHINLFGCTSDVRVKTLPSLACATNVFMLTAREHTGQLCKELLLPWDKGARTFTFPEGRGMRVGPGSEHEYLMVQVHYLVPRDWAASSPPVTDNTGLTVMLTSDPRAKETGLLAVADTGMSLPPGAPAHVHEVRLGKEELKRHLAHDLHAYGRVTPVAVHLHAHELGTRVRLEHWRDEEYLGTILEMHPYGGYGPDQELRPVGKGSGWALEEGDSLVLRCTFNTTGVTKPTVYGVGHGMEMCATAVLFESHDPAHAVSGGGGGNLADTRRMRAAFGLPGGRRPPGLAGAIKAGSQGAAWARVMAQARAKGRPPGFRVLPMDLHRLANSAAREGKHTPRRWGQPGRR